MIFTERMKQLVAVVLDRDSDAVTRALLKLGVMDLTALTMCMERQLPIVVFNFKTQGNIRRVVSGEHLGTLVTD